MLCKNYLLLLLMLFPLFSWSQPVASGRKSWSIYSSVGAVTGMNELARDVQFGLTKSLEKCDVFAELHLNSYSNSNVFRLSAMLGSDLLRINHLKRHPYFLYAFGGIGITHLSNPIFFDSYLLNGDDMLHLSIGIQPRWMITRTFGLIADIQFNQNVLIDYRLNQSFNVNLGFLLKI